MSAANNPFGKTICSICYEDLKPLVEDLQSISICGHVFHELCLQQWLEYCSNSKKCTCPVCKQKCSQENVGRLYFQSVGDPTELTQKPSGGLGVEEGNDPVLLRRELNKLKGKISAISTAFERQEESLKEVNKELCVCKEALRKETELRSEALQQKSYFERSYQSKSEELVKKQSECSRLQERSMALAKELAALKLVSDMNLDEDEVLKLASFGHGNNTKDTVDVLKKSLVLRNKSYKELMAQCNLLGRGESRSLKKLEKAKDKIKKLKTRLIELELAIEERDNEALRSLKASRRASSKVVDPNEVKSSTPQSAKSLSTYQTKPSAEAVEKPNQIGGVPILFRKAGNVDFHKDTGPSSSEKENEVVDVDLAKPRSHFGDDSSTKSPQPVQEHRPTKKTESNASKTGVETFTDWQNAIYGVSASSVGTKHDINNAAIGAMEDDVVPINDPGSFVDKSNVDDDIVEIPPFQSRKDASTPVPTPHPGDQCFAGGLLGPDGGTWHLGKWCKRSLTKTPISSTGTTRVSNATVADLISVGADGRGGRVKVLRTQNHTDVKTSSILPKKSKNTTKQSGQRSQGCMQIDHFFAKANK